MLKTDKQLVSVLLTPRWSAVMKLVYAVSAPQLLLTGKKSAIGVTASFYSNIS